MVKSEI
jgi:hypothetical protein